MSFFSDLVGGFTGSSARKDLSNANSKANADLASGYNAANGYYDSAVNNYNPYTQSGQQANAFYSNALGLNGDAARTSAENTITSDPLFTGKLNLDNSTALAYLNARGSAAGGAAVQAAQNNLYQNYGDVLNRYASLGAQGLQATGAQSNALMDQGNTAFGYGATKAGNDINYGNALAGTRSAGVNNLLGLLGTGISGYNALVNKGGGSTYNIGGVR
jgi:hypothetical protein